MEEGCKCIQLLLDADIPLSQKNNQKLTAYELAQQKNSERLALPQTPIDTHCQENVENLLKLLEKGIQG